MATDWTDNRKNLMLFSGRAHPELAEQVAKELSIEEQYVLSGTRLIDLDEADGLVPAEDVW